MVGGKGRTKTPRARVPGPRTAHARRKVLGNDPFARGAAPRLPEAAAQPIRPLAPAMATGVPASEPPAAPPAAAGSSAQPSGSLPAPASAPDPAAAFARLAEVERRVETALDGAEEGLSELAQRVGLQGAGADLREALSHLVPQLQAHLAAALDLAHLFEPAERLDRHGMDARFAERFAPVLEFLYASWWRTTVRDAARVPASGPAIVVANHAGVVPWDALVLRHALGRDHPAHRELRPLLDDRECALPLVGAAAIRLGAVRASPEAAEAILREGQLVGVFPEGSAGARKPWRDRYRLQRFGRGGFVKLALRTGAPIVPCAIVGSEEASPGISRTGWLAERLGVPLLASSAALRFGPAAVVPLPSRWSLRFGAPVPLDGLGPSQAEDASAVSALTERVRTTLQAMLEEDLAARSSVFL